MTRVLLLGFLIYFTGLSACAAMDWKDLHNQAGNLSLASALESAAKDPQSASKRYLLGLVYLDLHQDQSAGEIFNGLLRDEPGLLEAKWGKAEVLRRRHDTLAAERLLNAVSKTDPRFAPALISLAYIKYFQMDFKGSIKLALKVIHFGAGNVDLSNEARAYAMYAGAKGMLAHYGGLFSKAIDGLAVKPNLDKALKLQPDSPAVLFGLGSFYFLAPSIAGGDKIKAQEYLNRTIKADPLFADAYVRLAQLAKINNNLKQYDFYLGKALELDPQNELALDFLSGRCRFICAGGAE